MELYYIEEKSKLSKKGSRNSSSSSGRRVSLVGGGGDQGGGFLRKSASAREVRTKRRMDGSPPSFSNRCASLVKEQRARFYIMRRCVSMLVCWRDYP